MAEYITHSRAETVALGKRMAAVLQPGVLIAFTGGLGAGGPGLHRPGEQPHQCHRELLPRPAPAGPL